MVSSRPCRFTPGERAPGTNSIGGWVDPRAGLDDMEKWKFLSPPGLGLRPLGRPARRFSQQWLWKLLFFVTCYRVVCWIVINVSRNLFPWSSGYKRGGGKFLWNSGNKSTHFTASHARIVTWSWDLMLSRQWLRYLLSTGIVSVMQ
jgi:hypothetical protein